MTEVKVRWFSQVENSKQRKHEKVCFQKTYQSGKAGLHLNKSQQPNSDRTQ